MKKMTTSHEALVWRAFAFLAASSLASTALADEAADARFRGTGKADPIRVENVRLTQGPATRQGTVTCDLAWDHSWRAAWNVDAEQHGGKGTLKLENWDAAWVFVKFREGSDGLWYHAMLATNRADHGVPAGVALDVGLNDAPSAGPSTGVPAIGLTSSAVGESGGRQGAGVFVYRKKQGSGPNDFKDVSLRWQHPILLGETPFDPAKAEVRVFAIQMVRVPECAFWAGDGSTNGVMGQFSAGLTIHPFRIASEQPITLGGDADDALLCREIGGRNPSNLEDFDPNAIQTLPEAFPKGFRAFYCMRNEITQQQYADFLNMIPYAAQSARSGKQVNAPPGTPGIRANNPDWGSGRLGVKIAGSGVANAPDPVIINRGSFVVSRSRENPGKPAVYAADEPDVACNFISHIDGSHYAAWAGLRPLSELEFEKACRGPLKPVPNEFAWGTAQIAGMSASNGAYRLRNIGKPDETAAWEGDGGPDATHGNAALAAVWVEATQKQDFGPLRAGIFATPASDRVSAGASYWGILDLSGNVIERCITLGNPAGRAFNGTHGNGSAFPWSEKGFCVRGSGCTRSGNAATLAAPHRVSDRSYGIYAMHDARKQAQGFRCARTAP
ncbi:MAG: hypothetical protein FJ225_09915 [Lentisphaerae bacterium]|nr:hypothetical protein [Lentisphaerota bacterium]